MSAERRLDRRQCHDTWTTLRCRDTVTLMLPSELNVRSLPRLGHAVRGLRLHRGLTQAELAAAAGVSRQWVVNIESGRTSGIEVGRLMRLLDALHGSLFIHVDSADDV